MTNKINVEVGKKIRSFRKNRHISAQQLGNVIGKSKATLSKYENGTISIDLVTLYQIAEALNIQVEQLLYSPADQKRASSLDISASFFAHSTRFYSYYFDGRNNRVVRCVIDLFPDNSLKRIKTIMYMNVENVESCHDCENTYVGYTEHFDTLTSMKLQNQATPLESIYINILASFQETDKKWGLMAGVSFRPFVPIALKMLFSKEPLPITPEFVRELKISKDDIRMMKVFNMFTVL